MRDIFDIMKSSMDYTHRVIENENEYVALFMVPGHNKESLEILIEEDDIKISSKQKKNIPSINLQYKINMKGVYYKGVSAKCLDGILYVTFPKRSKRQNLISIK